MRTFREHAIDFSRKILLPGILVHGTRTRPDEPVGPLDDATAQAVADFLLLEHPGGSARAPALFLCCELGVASAARRVKNGF